MAARTSRIDLGTGVIDMRNSARLCTATSTSLRPGRAASSRLISAGPSGHRVGVEAPEFLVRSSEVAESVSVHITAGHFVGVEHVEPASDETAAVVTGKAADPHAGSDGSVMVVDMGVSYP